MSQRARAGDQLLRHESRLLRERAHRDRSGNCQRGLILTRTMLMELAEEIETMGLTTLAWRYRAVASGFDVKTSDRVH